MRKRAINEFDHIELDCGYTSPCHRPVTWRGVVVKPNPQSGYIQLPRTENGKRIWPQAHRVRYEAAHGPVDPELVIDHLCRNRACCNPAHMEAVTRAENLRRGVVAKLTPAQVNEIRALKGSGLTHREIGLRFDVSQAHTTNILNGKYWSDGPCPAWGVVKSRRAST